MISVVIPAYNEEKGIAACLDSLTRQKTSLSYEVVVVDNNSTDKTASIIKQYAKKMKTVYVLEKTPGSGAARARGFDEAKGDIILTTDADTVLPSDWIEKLSSPLSDERVAGVSSPCDIDDESEVNRRIFRFGARLGLELYRILRGHYWLAGFSYAVRKDTYKSAGKINKSLPALDDVELSERISNFGEIVYLHDFYVLASNRRYRDGLIKGMLSYIKPFVEIIYFHKSANMQDYR